LWKRQGESSERSGKDVRHVGVKEAGTSHPSSADSGSEAGSSNTSTRNGVAA
jgi:hypothetical protein